MQKSIFHYYYISRWLGTLQVAGLVSLITNFIYSIGDEFGGLGFMIGQVIFAIIIGQAIITVLSFTWGFPNIEAFFNTKMYYYNEKYDLNRDKFKTPLEMANLALTDFIEDLSKDNDKKVDGEYIKKSLDKSSNFRKNYLGDYGFDCISCNEMKNGNLDYLIYDKAYYNHTDEYKYNLEFDVSTCRFKEFVKKEK